MVDFELVELLKRDVGDWNAFVYGKRGEDPGLRVGLSRADLSGVDLAGADLSHADLSHADLSKANLSSANLSHADLSSADLSSANLFGANLFGTDLFRANLFGGKFTKCVFGSTFLIDLGLIGALGLESGRHVSGSTVGTNTLTLSRGKVPDVFLKGCGLADWEIKQAKIYDPDLQPGEVIDTLYEVERLRNTGPIQINPVFLSYSHHDADFVNRLQAALDEKGVRTWRDTKDAEAGPLDRVLGRAIEVNRIVLIVLSESSCYSDWMRFEIEKALDLEKELQRPVLCPVAIDSAWLEMLPPKLLPRIKDYNVIDLSEKGSIKKEMPRILKGLQIHYSGREERQEFLGLNKGLPGLSGS